MPISKRKREAAKIVMEAMETIEENIEYHVMVIDAYEAAYDYIGVLERADEHTEAEVAEAKVRMGVTREAMERKGDAIDILGLEQVYAEN